MDHRAVLLDQLRIERTQTPGTHGAYSGRWWLIGVSAAILMVAAVEVWIFRSARESIPVHTVVAKALATIGGGETPTGRPLGSSKRRRNHNYQ